MTPDPEPRFDARRDIGRPLTPLESAALDEQDRITDRREATHEWLMTTLSPSTLRKLGRLPELKGRE